MGLTTTTTGREELDILSYISSLQLPFLSLGIDYGFLGTCRNVLGGLVRCRGCRDFTYISALSAGEDAINYLSARL